jgi:hypothetical protein
LIINKQRRSSNELRRCSLCKVFAQAFFKKLAVSKGGALVARARAKFPNGAFLFAKLFLLVGAGARPVGDEASAINGKNKER